MLTSSQSLTRNVSLARTSFHTIEADGDPSFIGKRVR
jgi:hypothetical protein